MTEKERILRQQIEGVHDRKGKDIKTANRSST